MSIESSLRPRVLIVDLDVPLLKSLGSGLKMRGFDTLVAPNEDEAFKILSYSRRPDILVFDPYTFLDSSIRDIRSDFRIPLVVISQHQGLKAEIQALESSADSYLSKPLEPDLLAARIHATLRLIKGTLLPGQIVQVGNLEIDHASRTVKRSGQLVKLTKSEWGLIEVLSENVGRVMTSDQVASNTRGSFVNIDNLDYLRVLISRLRGKLEDNPKLPKYLRTVSGFGYILSEPEETTDQ